MSIKRIMIFRIQPQYTAEYIANVFWKHRIAQVKNITLFPYLLGHLNPNSMQFESTLDLILDSNRLWSNYGILSLSKKDKLFGAEENYWRGNIWINL